MARQPWFKFHTVDWRGDSKLRRCGLAARGLWIELLAIMHEAEPYGHLLIEGEQPSARDLAQFLGVPVGQMVRALAELEQRGVTKRTEAGVLFSKRMVRDHEKSVTNAANGSRGGNPKLKASVNGSVGESVNRSDIPARAHAHLASGFSASESSMSDEPGGEPERGRHAALMRPAPKNAAFAGRCVVPDFLDAEFERKSGKSYEERQAWYRRIDAEWAGRPVGESDLKFWRARFAEWIGPTSPEPERTSRNRAAAQRAKELLAQ